MTRYHELQKLLKLLDEVHFYFVHASGLEVSKPAIDESQEVKDAAWYDAKGIIHINPVHNPENLGIEELIAHEFFHHVQHELFWKKLQEPFDAKQAKRVTEFMEGTAFLFAALYLNRGTTDVAKINAYMNDKRHMTKSGMGNRQALKAFDESSHSPKEFITNALDYGFLVALLQDR